MPKIVLGIESSCDDTSVGLTADGRILANVSRSQLEHAEYGGVVPELASRAHLRLVTRVAEAAIKSAGLSFRDVDAIAVTRGPGLPGALMVGVSYAKGLALALGKPLIGVHHMEAHIHALWASRSPDSAPAGPIAPLIALIVSGGHTYLARLESPLEIQILGRTLDDAAGEAFDKTAKMLGLGYPGGPQLDALAELGQPHRFHFSRARVPGLDFSFSGLKTSVLYFLEDQVQKNPKFIQENIHDLCAGVRTAVVDMLLEKTRRALEESALNRLGIVGGVAANRLLRREATALMESLNGVLYLPDFEFCTDNGAMIALSGHFRLMRGHTDDLSCTPDPALPWTS
ncbi:MAG: tRNA (adenosine(37)-N6)-threonylcarbamoyltransferase complex transferase subunit TsaD [Flavobacteriales bacterium]|nr:tRNA (adenosine(37)-N6)-threonylcarbamoyltransferase complex transferase subunit TsaD [Flavobacteriales bacterium]MDW8431985.1 tRNA (adenosine(37)-N6)-threonylcarbamoyltransferase complex transferase subunit TsaD [Flavobacteriales bacterium]